MGDTDIRWPPPPAVQVAPVLPGVNSVTNDAERNVKNLRNSPRTRGKERLMMLRSFCRDLVQ